MKTMTISEFHAAMKAQAVPNEHIAFVCPMCGTVQSIHGVAEAMGVKPQDALKYVGFSCIGRFTDAGPPLKGSPPGKGCNWTLGGLLQLHDLEVIDEQGKHHPHFLPATVEQAQKRMAESVPSAESADEGVA